jgi:hypothetical protein
LFSGHKRQLFDRRRLDEVRQQPVPRLDDQLHVLFPQHRLLARRRQVIDVLADLHGHDLEGLRFEVDPPHQSHIFVLVYVLYALRDGETVVPLVKEGAGAVNIGEHFVEVLRQRAEGIRDLGVVFLPVDLDAIVIHRLFPWDHEHLLLLFRSADHRSEQVGELVLHPVALDHMLHVVLHAEDEP